jgi:hypothetical protein
MHEVDAGNRAARRNCLKRSIGKSALAPESPPKQVFRSGDIPPGAEQEIDSLSLFIDRRAMMTGPADFDLVVVDAPGPASRACDAVPAPLNITLDPARDRHMRRRNSTSGHDVHKIPKAGLEPQPPVPAEGMICRLK